MTERTIQLERTVVDEETLKVCDDCGREVTDDDRVTYHSTDGGSGAPDLHFHRECVGNVSLDDGVELPEGPTIHDVAQESSNLPIRLVLAADGFDLTMATIGAATLAAGLVINTPAGLIGLIPLAVGVVSALVQGQWTIDDLKRGKYG